jgi:streptogramin lyase/two-component sensor histidine kinase
LLSHAIVADGHGGYWLPTNNSGLLNWQPDLHKAKRYPLVAPDGSVLADRYMNYASVDHNGRLWVASSTGLATLAPGDSQLRMLDIAGPSGNLLSGGVLSVSVANDGKLWLGTTRGLVCFDPRSNTAQRYINDPKDSHSLSDDLVMATHVDASGSLWVGTQTGLNHASFEGDTLKMRRYSLADGLPDQTIDAISHDANGTLWVGTYKGVARLDAEHDRFVALGRDDGFPEIPINWRSVLASQDGSVYFGTDSGLWRIFPDQLHAAKRQPVMLSSYDVGSTHRINLRGQDIVPLTTDYTEAHVRFRVTEFGDRRSMSYRMVGLDEHWKDMPTDLSVGYDPLPSGTYRFEVRQADDEPSSLSVPLTVSPPPWRTPQAYLVYVAALLLVGFTFRQRLRLRSLENQALDARLRLLQAQVAPHFLFNTLANVQALIKAQSPRAEKVMRNVIAYLRASVPQLNERATTLGQELQLVQAYLELMRTRFPDHIEFALHADDSLYPLRCPPLTLLTLVENAVRHGIDPSENGGRIDIEVRRIDERCVIRVTDTGVGFREGSSGAGRGLSILRERLQLFFRGEAELRLTARSPHGTIAEIEIPASTVD